MSRVGNALKMLAILKSRGKISRGELSEILEVNKREISRYREDLEMAGLNIIETRGRYGGYQLLGREYFLDNLLTKAEVEALNLAIIHVDKDTFPYINDLMSAIEKINHSENPQNTKNADMYFKCSHIVQNYDIERIKWEKINDARISKYKIKIIYENYSGEKSERIVRPYGINFYNGAYYLIAYCEKRNEIRQFKFIRIMEIIVLGEAFKLDESFDLKKYLSNSVGIYKDGIFDIKLKVFYPYAQFFRENKWVEDESYEDFSEQGYLIYSAKMEGATQIMSWIMQMGENCILIEPESIRTDIIETNKNILKKYLK